MDCATLLLFLTSCLLWQQGNFLSIDARDDPKTPPYAKIGCPGGGPFASISECAIVCADSKCSNAISFASQVPNCDGILRSSLGLEISLEGQLVELISYAYAGNKTQITISSKESCLRYGENLMNSGLQERLNSLKEQKKRAEELFLNHQSGIMYLHMRHAGGTTLCSMMRANNLSTPEDSFYHRHKNLALYGGRYMSRNCNPHDMIPLFGTKEMHLEWYKQHKYRFYANEIHLPREKDLPLGDIVMGVQYRHPVSRIYSVYHDTFTRMDHHGYIHSIQTDSIDVKSCSKKAQERYQVDSQAITRSKEDADKNTQQSRSTQSACEHKASRLPSPTSEWIVNIATDAVAEVLDAVPATKPLSRKNSLDDFKQWLQRYILNRDLAYFSSMKDYDLPSQLNGLLTSNTAWRNAFSLYRTVGMDDSHLKVAMSVIEKFSFVVLLEGTSSV